MTVQTLKFAQNSRIKLQWFYNFSLNRSGFLLTNTFLSANLDDQTKWWLKKHDVKLFYLLLNWMFSCKLVKKKTITQPKCALNVQIGHQIWCFGADVAH